ncbi:hypothetical protein [Limimaricola cinnabarinus]|uniref:Uncharacterized protein n=1 Tax=Limimaricola cinnabarinus LL-001 TaxID=1337093 RepID=U2YJC0_9RHOB|nr:hypothetical protein [Limimaricola cinnabarinus]GAD54921.1 hypothetical protein MBELCI_0973 [Limimaricola cinnabarinus LL-001]
MSQFTHALTKLHEARSTRDAALTALTLLENTKGVGSAEAKKYDDETVGPLHEKVSAAEARLRDAEPKTQREYLLKVGALLEEGMLSETVTALRADAERLAATGEDPVVALCQRWKSMRTAVAGMLDEEVGGHFDAPELEEAEEAQRRIERQLQRMVPTSAEGLAAMMDVYWNLEGPVGMPGTEGWEMEMQNPQYLFLRRLRHGAFVVAGQAGTP